jgi:hypothetical protein
VLQIFRLDREILVENNKVRREVIVENVKEADAVAAHVSEFGCKVRITHIDYVRSADEEKAMLDHEVREYNCVVKE